MPARFKSISVIIPTLNDEILRPTVDTVLAARRPEGIEIEVLVVGKDEAQRVSQDDRVHFVDTGRNMIPAEARNHGAKHAAGELFVFLDSDAFVEADWFEALVAAFPDDRQVVHGAMQIIKDTRCNVGDNVATFHSMHVSNPPRVMDSHVAAYCLAVTPKVFEEMEGFRENIFMAEDWEFANRVREAGYSIYFEPTFWITHHSNRHTRERLVSHAQSYAIGFMNMLDAGAETGTRFRVDWLGHLPPLAALWSATQASMHSTKLFLRYPAMRPYLFSYPCVWLFYYARRRHILRMWAGKAPRTHVK